MSLGISVTQAILHRDSQARLSTSSIALDDAFLGLQSSSRSGVANPNKGTGVKGGIARGTVSEIVGPPGSGKTTFALQIVANAVKHGESVIWIDTSSILPVVRLRGMLTCILSESGVVQEALSRVHCLSIRSLAGLLALLLYSAHTETSIFAKAEKLAVLVIDDLSTPITATYPPGFEEPKQPGKEHVNVDSASLKRTNVLKELGNKLTSLAVKRNLAVIVLNQLTTKVVSGSTATLVPALGDAWTSICSYRVTLYRQLVPPSFCHNSQQVRFAYFQKCDGLALNENNAKNIPFLITDKGIEDVEFPEDDEDVKKRALEEDTQELEQGENLENPTKKRRVLSFREEVVDDSEGEGDDFWFSAIAEVTDEVI